MKNVIKIDEAKLNDEFEKLLDDMYLTYHIHPTNIPHYNITSREQLDIAIHDAQGRMEEAEQEAKDKKVHHHGNPDYCNGLPRKR